jgi:hypothetical protein
MAASYTVFDGDKTDSSQDAFGGDVEKKAVDVHLQNTTVSSFAWQDVTVTVKDHKTKQPKVILQNVNGIIKAGMLTSCNGRMRSTHIDQANYVLLWAHQDAARLLC